jgi:bifunctional DNase/RNase
MDMMLGAEIWTIARLEEGTAVLLRPLGSGTAVPIFIGQSEAQAILLGLGEVIIPRPLTHDLLLKFAEKQGLDLLRVEIHDITDGVFYSKLIFSTGLAGTSGMVSRYGSVKNPLVLDSRPSDALALAVRRKCPILIAPKVVELAGLPVEFFLDALGGELQVSADTHIDTLAGVPSGLSDSGVRREALLIDLDRAVAEEEYERAAEIRDVLALMDKNDRNGRT